MNGLFCLMVLSPYLIAADSAYCNGSSYGTEFVFGFLDLPFYTQFNRTPLNPDLSVMIHPQEYSSTYYYVSLESTNSASKTPTIITTREYTYSDGEVLRFNSTFINRYKDIYTGGVINISSDEPVSLMAMYTFRDGDRTSIIMYPILPTSVLSSDYVIPSYSPSSNYHGRTQFMAVGVNDSTSIRFEGYETGSMVYDVDHNDIFMYQRGTDLSSTSAVSNHPFAMFSWITTGDVSYLRNRNSIGRSLAMQVPPFDKSAVHFVIPSLSGDSIQGYKVRIYAFSRNAVVEIYSSSESTQNVHVYNKIYYEFAATDRSEVFEIVSDSPKVVVQIALNSLNMPLFMTAIPAISQFMTLHKVKFPYIRSSMKSIIVITPYKEATGLLINRDPVIHNIKLLKKTPLGNYTVLTRPVGSSSVTVGHAGSEPIGVIALGQWQWLLSGNHVDDAYGFVAGIQFTSLKCGSTGPGQIAKLGGSKNGGSRINLCQER